MSMTIKLGSVLSNGTGGEGAVYEILGRPDLVYKRYKQFKLTPTLESKLVYMMTVPPKTIMGECISWPTLLVKNTSGKLDGFVMPRLKFNIKLNDVYENKRYSYDSLVIVAGNLCTLVHQLHKNSIIIGDFNHGNVGVYEINSIVSMMDCDSFHLDGGQYPCCVCMDGYVAPELLKHLKKVNTARYDTAPPPTFTQQTDLFSLATHIFRLLMKGVSPYNGINTAVRVSSDVVSAGNEPIEKGMYVFRQGLTPAHPACPPKHILTDELINLFEQAFLFGEQSYRPGALVWHKALLNYQSSLTTCSRNQIHKYYSKLSCCPWCEAEQRESTFNNTRSAKNLPHYKVKRK